MSILYSSSFSVDDLATKWTVVVGTWAVTGGVLRCSAGATPRIIRNNTGAYAATADMLVTVKYAAGTTFDGGPVVRYQSGADTCYYLDATAGAIEVFRRVAGVDTSLGTRTAGALGDSFGLQVSGTGATVTLKVFKNGTQVGADYSDSNAARITATGFGGILDWSNASNQDFDDFSVDDLAAPPPPPGTTAPLGMYDPEDVASTWYDPEVTTAGWWDWGYYESAYIPAAGGAAAVSDVSLATMIPMALMAM